MNKYDKRDEWQNIIHEPIQKRGWETSEKWMGYEANITMGQKEYNYFNLEPSSNHRAFII